jgi:hypothetical protein
VRPTAAGAELQLVWRSEKNQKLDYAVAVHVMNPDGSIRHNLDYPQDPAAPWVAQGTTWRDIVHLPIDAFAAGSTVAVGLYRMPEGLLPIDRGPRDDGHQRLLISLPGVTAADWTQPGRNG